MPRSKTRGGGQKSKIIRFGVKRYAQVLYYIFKLQFLSECSGLGSEDTSWYPALLWLCHWQQQEIDLIYNNDNSGESGKAAKFFVSRPLVLFLSCKAHKQNSTTRTDEISSSLFFQAKVEQLIPGYGSHRGGQLLDIRGCGKRCLYFHK